MNLRKKRVKDMNLWLLTIMINEEKIDNSGSWRT